MSLVGFKDKSVDFPLRGYFYPRLRVEVFSGDELLSIQILLVEI